MRSVLPLILLLAFATPAFTAEDARPEIDTLVRSYYDAMAAEDLGKVATLLHLTDEDAAKALLERYHLIFQATDLSIRSLKITDVKLDEAGEGGVVYATVQTTIAKPDGSDSFEKASEVALVVARAEGRWRILRATTQGRLAMERKLILHGQHLAELRESADGSTKEPWDKDGDTTSRPTEDTPPQTENASAAKQPEGVAGWMLVAGFLALLALFATRLAFAQRLLGALLVAPLIAGTLVALGNVALGDAPGELALPEVLLSPWTLWESGQVWLPAAAWAAGGLVGGLIVAAPVRALLAGVLIPLGPWILIQKPWFESIPASAQGFQDTFERLACGAPHDLQALLGACLVGALFGGLILPGGRSKAA